MVRRRMYEDPTRFPHPLLPSTSTGRCAVRLRVILALAVMAATVTATAPVSAAAPVATTVTVDMAGTNQELNNPARYQNQQSALPPGDLASVEAINAKITRVWLSPDAKLKKRGWATKYRIFDQAAEHSRRIMVVLLPCDKLFERPDPTECLRRTEEGLRHFKKRYPTIKYVEFYNELDMEMTAAAYYRWYQRGYEIVNRVNADLTPKIRIRVGGPSASSLKYCEMTDTGWFKDFLQAYAEDSAPGKKLDFISYHSYNLAQKGLDACDNPVFPPHAEQEKRMLSDLLGRLGVPRDTPIYVTESGLFAGAGTGTTVDNQPNPSALDQQIQAAGMATLGMYYTLGEMDAPFHWGFNHDTWDRKSMFVDDVDGAVLPYYNVVRMQTMLKSRLLRGTTVSTAPYHGRGITVFATADDTGLAAMVTNYQAFDRAEEHSVTFDPGLLPWTGRSVRFERYLIDATHSNYNANPARAGLEKVEDFVFAPDATFRRGFPARPNSVSLVVYTPLPLTSETEDPPFTAAGGPATASLTPSQAAAG
jgi:hypothetical protein